MTEAGPLDMACQGTATFVAQPKHSMTLVASVRKLWGAPCPAF